MVEVGWIEWIWQNSPVGRDIFLGKVCFSMEYFRFGNNKDMIFLRERMSNFVSCLYIHYVVMFCCMYVVSGMLDSTPYFSYYLDDKLTFFALFWSVCRVTFSLFTWNYYQELHEL